MSSKDERRIALVLEAADDLATGADGVTETIRDIASKAGCCERTVFRDVKALRNGDLERNDEALTEEQMAAYLRTMNASQAWRELGCVDGTGMSLRTFQRRVRAAVPGRLEAGLRDGVPGSFATSIVASRIATEPNERWEIDTKELDVTVVDDDGDEFPVVNIIGIIDHATRVIIDWEIVYAPVKGVDVRRVLTRAMLGHVIDDTLVGGVPAVVITDQGADYTSHEVQRLTDAVRCLLDPLPAYSPHLKGTVERSFRTLDIQWTHGLPGHAGKAQRADESVIRDDQAMHAEDLESSLQTWLDGYHRRMHEGNGRPPIDEWRARMDTPVIPTVDQIAPFLEDRHHRTITNRGVRIDNRFFKCGELGDHMKREVEVLTLDGARVAEVFRNNRHVGRAIAEPEWTERDLHRLLGERQHTTAQVKELRSLRDDIRQAATPSTKRPGKKRSKRDSRDRLLPAGTGLRALKKQASVPSEVVQEGLL